MNCPYCSDDKDRAARRAFSVELDRRIHNLETCVNDLSRVAREIDGRMAREMAALVNRAKELVTR